MVGVAYFLKGGRELKQYTGASLDRLPSPLSSLNNVNSDNQERRLNEKENNIYYVDDKPVVNRWYGWQPKIQAPMECPWRDCFKRDHNCSTCRDSPGDLMVTNSSSLDPGEDWIPDVTMLRRMYEDGHDADGNPWPPPLDDELCQAMVKDSTKTMEALDVLRIKSAPIPRTPETKNNKVLCMIYTTEKAHASKIRAMRETWAPGCDGFLAFSTKSDPRIPAISIPHEGREHYKNMWQKVRSMWFFVGKHYLSEFDWFHIGGDDMHIFPQNLKKFLGNYSSSEPHFLGRVFGTWKSGFNTGGPGYTLSRPSLKCLVDNLSSKRCKYRKESSEEDVLTAHCLRTACNISVEDTRDEQKRHRFHHMNPGWAYTYKGRLKWYREYNQKVGGTPLGKNCCAPDSTSFHQISPPMMRYLHHYVHNCNRSGI